MSETLSKTQLHPLHIGQKAKMADFGGWEMPIEYQGVVAEHTAVRTQVGVFDVSHMGKLRLRGENVARELNDILTSNVLALAIGQAGYSLLLNENGGVIDDLLIYRVTESEIWVVPNAANAAKVAQILEGLLSEAVTLENFHQTHGILAVQGPKSAEVLQIIGIQSKLDYMQVAQLEILGETVSDSLLCRSGYTGELGFEIITENSNLTNLWQQLLAAGVQPIGLGARDTLRTEMGYPLHGQDISPTISPVSAGLKWAIDLSGNFIGKTAIMQEIENPKLFRVGLQLIDRGIPRAHMSLYLGDSAVGETTSGTFSPTLKVGIALALVSEKLAIGERVEIDIRGKRLAAEIVKLPFVESHVR